MDRADDRIFGDGGNPRVWAAWILCGDTAGLPELGLPAQMTPEATK